MQSINASLNPFTALISAALLVFVTFVNATQTVDNFLNKNDHQRLEIVFDEGLKSTDIMAVYYSVINSKNIPAGVKTNLCAKLAVYHKDSKLGVSFNWNQ
jgi:capsular polysaccharide biosynthesis protein